MLAYKQSLIQQEEIIDFQMDYFLETHNSHLITRLVDSQVQGAVREASNFLCFTLYA